MWKYLPLALLALALRLAGVIEFQNDTSPEDAQRLHAYAPGGDAESLLSRGELIPFSKTGIYELELIPKISDSLAFKIDRRHFDIVARSRTLAQSESAQAFEIATGVGEQNARKLARYIDVRR